MTGGVAGEGRRSLVKGADRWRQAEIDRWRRAESLAMGVDRFEKLSPDNDFRWRHPFSYCGDFGHFWIKNKLHVVT